jgi:hypothetical protein
VDAEIVRDIALAASGLLDAKVGGPSVNPPAPEPKRREFLLGQRLSTHRLPGRAIPLRR